MPAAGPVTRPALALYELVACSLDMELPCFRLLD